MADDVHEEFISGPQTQFVQRPLQSSVAQATPATRNTAPNPEQDLSVKDQSRQTAREPLIPVSPLLQPLEQAHLEPHLIPWPDLRADIDKIVAEKPELGKLGIAVVALGKETSRYAAINDTKIVPALSIGKLAGLYAAFQLRADLRAVIREDSNKHWTFPMLSARLKERWADSSAPDVTRLLSRSQGQPMLESIFDKAVLSKQKQIEFSGWKPIEDDKDHRIALDDLDTAKNANAITQRPFYDLVWLMARWSTATASSEVIRRVGGAFIAALMIQTGLWRKKWPAIQDPNKQGDDAGVAKSAEAESEEGGLFLRDAYDKHRFKLNGFPGERGPNKEKDFLQSATPRALASFMTCLYRDWLVDAEASSVMKLILDKSYAPFGARSPVRQILLVANQRPVRVISKLGLLDYAVGDCALVLPLRTDETWHPYGIEPEAVISERAKQASLELRYVVVALEDHSAREGPKGDQPIFTVVKETDIALANRAARGE
jgi:hypothetical protein